MTVNQVYAPTTDVEEQEIFGQIEYEINRIYKQDLLSVVGE